MEHEYRDSLLDELHIEQESLVDHLIGKVSEFFVPVWNEDEDGTWRRSGYYSAPDPEFWEAYYDGYAIEY